MASTFAVISLVIWLATRVGKKRAFYLAIGVSILMGWAVSKDKQKPPAFQEGRGGIEKRIPVPPYFELEIRLAWLAPFLILLCLIQLIVERSLAPVFSI